MDDEPGRSPEATHAEWLARELGLELHQTTDVNSDESLEAIRAAKPKAIVVCAFGQLVKEPLLSEFLINWVTFLAEGLAIVLVMVGVSPLLFAYVSEAAGLTVGLLAAGVLLISFAALYVEIIWGVHSGAEEDEAERAVARLVSGRGIGPPPPDER